ncbi:hypothetical protein Bca4012_101727 [Brassica carinata]
MATFLIAFLLAAAVFTHGKEVVKDTNGNPVKPGAKYFIQAVETESNMGGGLIPNAIKYPTCPFGITQTRFPPEMWVFCTEFSKLWAVDVSSSAAKEPAIIIGGELRRPDSVFKLVVTQDEAKTLFVKFVKVVDVTTATTTTSSVEKL